MAHLYRLTAFLCFLYPSLCFPQSAPVGAVDLAGWIKNENGTYTKAFNDSNGSSRVTLSSAPKGITTTSTALVQTSKGITAMDIVKTANVNTARLGSAMVGLAKKAGPLGMTLTAAALVCELTDICNQAGQWMMNPPSTPEAPNSYPATNGQWWGWGTKYYPTVSGACGDSVRLTVNVGSGFVFDHSIQINADTHQCYARRLSDGNVFYASNTSKLSGCAPGYTVNGANCVKDGVAPVPATNTDLDNAASKLNDDRVTPHLIEANEPLPTDDVPTLTPDQKKNLGLDSVPTKDASGNVTGRQDTTTAIEAVDAGTSDNPGRVIIKETKTTVNYDNSNNQISSTTSTSYTNQPQVDQKQQSFEIKFDEVPAAELPGYSVPATLTSSSWGSGTCPPDIDINLSSVFQSVSVPMAPVCDTAEKINPFVVLIASLAAIYIVAGVRGGEYR